MDCGCYYCIYNKNSVCILDGIEIDFAGMCVDCEVVNIPTEILEKHKEERLKVIEQGA